ncbi:alpha-N-arabinofuranosidase [Aestuariibaculum suncheonense]|uniref:non-reducing end alpha-L-arabinofuranosidase n=1 Tax=Aestuariibaculum suncheonense TaxID=1028745 RepID=A0A8J6QYG0_9FLAO|nr:alpha-L-arabinofuranosidase C-terminal domain-containing protein [Aestuariibaculum suncheonense]MBD0836799.1 alpha-N-arabinofuranosidase [Aestuariibaculum suncheonense]
MTALKTKLLKPLALFVIATAGLNAQNNTTSISIQVDDNAPVISKHIYGHFAEHLGRSVYDGFYVGEDSEIPNTNGIRNDIVEALKGLKIPNLRWPGGCFADEYHWKDGVGPKAERPVIVNTHWGMVEEDNSFGTHEFLELCELLGAEPYLAGNVGSGTVEELNDWVEYCNYDGNTSMAQWRKANGQEEPWRVKYWGIGNESWGCGGNMTPEYFANLYRQYATYARNYPGIDIKRIASGADADNYRWTEVMMRDVPHGMMWGLSVHYYTRTGWPPSGSATKFDESDYFSIMKTCLKTSEILDNHIAIMDKYDPKKRVALVVDEWGSWYAVEEGTNPGFAYQQNSMRDAMIAGITLNMLHERADRIKMANLAQAVNVLQAVILTKDEKMLLTPTYHVMKMYTAHQDAKLLPLSFDSPEYNFNGESLPAISASASKDKEGLVHISLVNIDSKKENTIEIDCANLGIKDFTANIVASKHLQDHNTFDNPSTVKVEDFKDFKFKKNKLTITIPPFSVVMLEGK